jgi:hypothetical protein
MPRNPRSNSPKKTESTSRSRKNDSPRMSAGRSNDDDREMRHGKSSSSTRKTGDTRKATSRSR